MEISKRIWPELAGAGRAAHPCTKGAAMTNSTEYLASPDQPPALTEALLKLWTAISNRFVMQTLPIKAINEIGDAWQEMQKAVNEALRAAKGGSDDTETQS